MTWRWSKGTQVFCSIRIHSVAILCVDAKQKTFWVVILHPIDVRYTPDRKIKKTDDKYRKTRIMKIMWCESWNRMTIFSPYEFNNSPWFEIFKAIRQRHHSWKLVNGEVVDQNCPQFSDFESIWYRAVLCFMLFFSHYAPPLCSFMLWNCHNGLRCYSAA